MIKYAKVIDPKTKKCDVGTGTNARYYESIGMVEMDVEQAYNGQWYVKGYAPAKPAPTIKEQVEDLEKQYDMNRWQREAILAEGSAYSDYTKEKAQEIETLAEQLRVAENGTGVL